MAKPKASGRETAHDSAAEWQQLRLHFTRALIFFSATSASAILYLVLRSFEFPERYNLFLCLLQISYVSYKFGSKFFLQFLKSFAKALES